MFEDRPVSHHTRKPHDTRDARVRFGEKIPEQPSEIALSVVDKNRRGVDQANLLTHVLQSLKSETFLTRPVWLKKAMEELCYAPITCTGKFYLLGELLPIVAFTYTTGPWKGAWVRYGVDLSASPLSRWMQVIGFRIEIEILRNAQQRYKNFSASKNILLKNNYVPNLYLL